MHDKSNVFPPPLDEIGLDPDAGATSDEHARGCLEIARDSDIDAETRGLAVSVLGPGVQLGDEVLDWDDPIEFTYFSQTVWEEVCDALEQIYQDADMPKVVRRRALEVAVRGPGFDWTRDAVRAAWQSKDRDWMLTSVFCMGWVDGFAAELAEAFENPPNEEVLQEAIGVAAQNHDSSFAPVLEKIASGKTDHERDTRLTAIGALATAGPGRLESWQVLDELSRDSDPEIAEEADLALDEYLMLQAMTEEFAEDEFL